MATLEQNLQDTDLKLKSKFQVITRRKTCIAFALKMSTCADTEEYRGYYTELNKKIKRQVVVMEMDYEGLKEKYYKQLKQLNN